MRKLEIEIPNDKEIDWEASAKQKQVVFKGKQLTYEDVCEKLFYTGHYFINDTGEICHLNFVGFDANSASNIHQLECILAKNMLANVARYLNGELNKSDFQKSDKYIIWADCENSLHIASINNVMTDHGYIIFKSQELAQQAIEILGEETVRLALEPLY